MSRDTPLDEAHRAMIDPKATEADHHRYYGRLAAAELFVLLEGEARETFAPRLIEDAGVTYALAFDREDRLAAYLDTPGEVLTISGRELIRALRKAGLGLGVNLGLDAATMLPPGVLAWIDERISPGVAVEEARLGQVAPPASAGADLVALLSERLPILSGLAEHAVLAEAGEAGDRRLLLALAGVPEPARTACAGAVAEALRLAGIEAALDSVFVEPGDLLHVAISKVGLRFDIPAPPVSLMTLAPGSDPEKPPILN